MTTNHALRFVVAAVAMTIGATAARAGTPVTLELQSTPVYWSVAGSTAILVLQYDKNASGPLIVEQFAVTAVVNDTQTQTLDNCGTPITTGALAGSYSLAPGQHCFLQSPRTNGGSFFGHALITDRTNASSNMRNNVRAMIEVRDSANNVLTHVELR